MLGKYFFFIVIVLLSSCQQGVEPSKPTAHIYRHDSLILGVDLSYTNAMLDHGGIFRHGDKVDSPYKIMSSVGANVVRVRLWHNPAWQSSLYGSNRYSDLPEVAKTIKAAKDQGMAILLDLHYSDDWADPSKQAIPSAWVGLSLEVLRDSVYNYTLKTLQYLDRQALTPEYIQIGNETNNGMLLPAGRIVNGDFGKLALLINGGIKAVRDHSTASGISTKIVLHAAQLQHAMPWYEGIANAGVTDFDIIGLSHYDKWSEVHTMQGVTDAVKALKNRFSKDVVIVETAFPFSNQNQDGYGNIISANDINAPYPVSPEGQRDYMIDLVKAVIAGGGRGVIYWEPTWISTSTFKDRWGTGSSWENCTFFGSDGATLPVIEYLTYDYKL